MKRASGRFWTLQPTKPGPSAALNTDATFIGAQFSCKGWLLTKDGVGDVDTKHTHELDSYWMREWGPRIK